MEIDSEERPLLAKGPSVNHMRLCSILPRLLLSVPFFLGGGMVSRPTVNSYGETESRPAPVWVPIVLVLLGFLVLGCRTWWYSFDVEGDTLVVKQRTWLCCCFRVRKFPVKDIGSLVYTTEQHPAFCGADFTGVYATVGLPQESPKPLEPWETRRDNTVNVAFQVMKATDGSHDVSSHRQLFFFKFACCQCQLLAPLSRALCFLAFPSSPLMYWHWQIPLSMTCKEKSPCCAGAGLSDYKRTFYRLQAALGFVPNPAFREYVEAKRLKYSHLLSGDQYEAEQVSFPVLSCLLYGSFARYITDGGHGSGPPMLVPCSAA
jgi:hypothetical protein